MRRLLKIASKLRNARFRSPPRCRFAVFGTPPELLARAIPKEKSVAYIPSDTSVFYVSPKFLCYQILWFLRLRDWGQSFVNACISTVGPKLLFTYIPTDIRIHKAASYFFDTRFFVLQNALTTLFNQKLPMNNIVPRGEYKSELAVFGPKDKEKLLEQGYKFNKIHVWGNWKGPWLIGNFWREPSTPCDSVIFYVSVLDPPMLGVSVPSNLSEATYEYLIERLDPKLPENKFWQDVYRVAFCNKQENFVFSVLNELKREQREIQVIVLGRNDNAAEAEAEAEYFLSHLPEASFVPYSANERRGLFQKTDGLFISTHSNLISDALSVGRRAVWLDVAGTLCNSFSQSDWYLRRPTKAEAKAHIKRLLSMSLSQFKQRNSLELEWLNSPLSEGNLDKNIERLFSKT